MKRLLKFGRNMHGRDFVVGDVHGCFDLLRDHLAAVSFNEASDRLFSVGDLVDRGLQSSESIDWIAKPWFHAVRGNHEQMAIGVAAGRHDPVNYAQNGGLWFLALPMTRQAMFAKAFDALPYLIEIDTSSGRVGIVHADINGDSWDDFTHALDEDQSRTKRKRLTEVALWSRDRITQRDCASIKDLHCLYVGHTPVVEPVELGNVRYIDTGAVFGGRMTLIQIDGDIALKAAA